MLEIYRRAYSDGVLKVTILLKLPQNKGPGILIERCWTDAENHEQELAWTCLSVDDLIDVINDPVTVALMHSSGVVREISLPYAVISDALSYLQTVGAFTL